MKKIILFTFVSLQAFSQTKPIHISVVQGLSTQGAGSKNTDYHFSFNLISGTVGNLKGAEIGSLYNQNEGDMVGFQASGLMNITKGNIYGMQVAGLSNISLKMNGLQIAGINNMAQNVNGMQIAGILNRAALLKGLQIGLINMADSVQNGGGIGLINIYKKGGYRELELSVADNQNVGLSYKTGTKGLYTIVTIGYNFNPQSLLITGGGLGTLLAVSKNTFIKPELVFYSYSSDDPKFENLANATHLKIGIMHTFSNIALTLMPSIYHVQLYKNAEGMLKQISKLGNSKSKQWGFGIGLGLGFIKK